MLPCFHAVLCLQLINTNYMWQRLNTINFLLAMSLEKQSCVLQNQAAFSLCNLARIIADEGLSLCMTLCNCSALEYTLVLWNYLTIM